jgi:hypothetical protein
MSAQPTDAAVIADLTRVKALFQARAIAAVIGAPPPTELPVADRDFHLIRLPNGDLMRAEAI